MFIELMTPAWPAGPPAPLRAASSLACSVICWNVAPDPGAVDPMLDRFIGTEREEMMGKRGQQEASERRIETVDPTHQR